MGDTGKSITFGVLGPVAVWSPTGPIAVREPRRRAMLGALLLDVGHAVSVWRLAELVWGEDQPASSRKAIQVYVSQLRRVLDGLPGVTLATGPDGYRLSCRTEAVDLHRFRRLVRQARQQRRPAPRKALLRRALALWRGPAFADTGAVALRERVAPGLEEERLGAVEDLYDAELADGGHSAILGSLVALTAEHPLRERLTGQLMLALHRCGRGPEAAQVFRTFRHRLVLEAGMEPGAGLSAVHRQVLGGRAASPADLSALTLANPAGLSALAFASPPALIEIADQHTRTGDFDRALAFLYAARALARERADAKAVEHATRCVTQVSRLLR